MAEGKKSKRKRDKREEIKKSEETAVGIKKEKIELEKEEKPEIKTEEESPEINILLTEKEEVKDVEKEKPTEETKIEEKDDTFKILIVIGILVGCFVLFIAVRHFTGEKVVTIDDLHRMNLEGKESENNYMYHGYSFVRVGDLWYTQIQRGDKLFDIALHHGPRELENVSVSGRINSTFNSDKIYISFNPEGKHMEWTALAAAALSTNLAKGIGVTPVAACDRNATVCEGRPIVTCASGKPVIYLSQAKENAGIVFKGNCVTLEGKQDELMRAVERFLLMWYKVM